MNWSLAIASFAAVVATLNGIWILTRDKRQRRYEAALIQIAYPERIAKTEEGALIQIEVEKIAKRALGA